MKNSNFRLSVIALGVVIALGILILSLFSTLAPQALSLGGF